ncbi:S8 family serine peptidase [Kribbella sp. NPDC020789]
MVTLITGDTVRIAADRTVQPTPGPGRAGVRFRTERRGDHVSVIPLDALPLIAAQRIDPRLFDVTELLTAGYGDARSTTLPLIVASSGSPSTTLRAAGGTGLRPLPLVHGMAAALPKSKVSSLYGALSARTGGISRIWLDGRRKLLLDHSVPQIGAPAAWAAGYTGRGVKVAVLDSGVDAAHPDFAGRLQTADFTVTNLEDNVGHGTHVGSIIGGSGAASGGQYRGVAPDATILSGKVCADEFCEESAILAGMDWAVQQGARIVNLSFGGYDWPGVDPLEEAVNRLTAEHGTLFVVSAGNEGPSDGTISSPGSAAAALTVGAVDRDDKLAEFSSRGPTTDGLEKPDVTAPGVDIVAAKSAHSTIGEPVGSSYLKLSGTSMAAPHVAGAAALLAQEHPDWKADRLKAALMTTAVPTAGLPTLKQGSGRIDVGVASAAKVTADSGLLTFAKQNWPHTDDSPEAKPITYANDGDEAVTLQLTAALAGPDGKAAPEGALSLSASTVTVPAHGTTQVVVTSNTNHGGSTGRYTGQLVAKGGNAVLTTRLAVESEVESYSLTVKHLDRNGAVTGDYVDTVLNRNAGENDRPITTTDPDGITNLRLAKGEYSLDSVVGTGRGPDDGNLLVQPKLDLTSDQTVTIDARQAKPVTISVPQAGAEEVFVANTYGLHTPTLTMVQEIVGFGGATIRTAQLGSNVPEISSVIRSQWARPDPEGGESYDNSPYLYSLAWPTAGGIATGFTKAVRRTELATVRPAMQATAAGTSGVLSVMGEPAGQSLGGVGWGYPYQLPATPNVYVTTAGVTWRSDVILVNGDQAAFLLGNRSEYRTGRTYREVWGGAVFGPAAFRDAVAREGDVMDIAVEESDGLGHHGWGLTGNGTISLSRDGVPVATTQYPPQGPGIQVDVPAGAATYQLDLETTSSGVLASSTAVRSSWRFRSDSTSARTAVPLWAVRFSPTVDEHNVSHSRVLPMTLEHTGAVGRVRAVKLAVSTDGGTTWRPTALRQVGTDQYVAEVATPGDVSLKASVTDSAGNTVEQVIEKAYTVDR